MKIGVSGASGQLGRAVVSELLQSSSVMLANALTGLSRRGSRVRVPSAPPLYSMGYVYT